MMTSPDGNIFLITVFCEVKPPVASEFPSQRPVTQIYDNLFDLRLNNRSKNPTSPTLAHVCFGCSLS